MSPAQYRAWAEAPAAAAGDRRRSATRPRPRLELAAFYEALPAAAGRGRASSTSATRSTARSRCCASAPAALARAARALPLRAGRRVPGHQPRAARAGAPAGRRGPGPNITVVGDDDQAIYRWRGAASANLLAFRRLYPGAREVVLNENHRSTQVILDASARLISLQQPAPAGGGRRHRQAAALAAPRAARRCVHLRVRHGVGRGRRRRRPRRGAARSAGYRPRDVAMLVRSNGDADPFLRALNVRGIAAPLQRQPRPLRARGGAPADRVPARAREPGRLGLGLLPGRVRALPAARVRAAAPQPPRAPQDPPAARGAARPAGERGARSASAAPRARRAARLLADLEARRRRRAAAAHGRGALRVPAVRRACSAAARARRSAEAEAKVRNIARFFDAVKRVRRRSPSTTACPAFVEHLDLLREAGDDPAVAEADLDDDAVARADRAQGEGPRVPASCSWSAAPRTASRCSRRTRRAGAAGGPRSGDRRHRRRRAPARGAAPLLRRR